jgi:hypothetical protein
VDRREVNQKWYSSFNEKRMLFIIEDGEGNELEIPAKFEVCSTCDGKGKHVNPAIDSNGLTEEDFDMDPDFRENYFSGMYDMPCNECKGRRVSPIVNEEGMSEELKEYVNNTIQEHYDYERMCYMERKMGC